MSTLLGIDIGGTAVKIGVVDENGKVLLSETRSVSFDGYKTSIMTTVANLAGEILEKSPVKVEGIGVSATGQIDVSSGTVIGVGAQLGDWLGSPVKKILEDRFYLPVTVINDGRSASRRLVARRARRTCLSLRSAPALAAVLLKTVASFRADAASVAKSGIISSILTVLSARAATAAALSATVLRARLCAVLRRMLHCSKSWAYRQKTSTAK